jgi:hypothetical protein
MKIVIDIEDFCDWSMKKYGLSSNDWHRLIFRPFMFDYFINAHASVGFSITENPRNLFEEHMNEFINENPQLLTRGTTLWIESTI